MEEKLQKLFEECKLELQNIGIDLTENNIGRIDISFAKRKTKRYGCCRQEEPDKSTRYRTRGVINYRKFKVHHIEISKWVMDLNEDIIKNTIIHEIIHCLPDCNNHGKIFKYYAKIINENLNYNITRVGNKEKDYEKSNVEFPKDDIYKYNYKIICTNCNYIYYRNRLAKNFLKRYRCGVCKGKLKLLENKI